MSVHKLCLRAAGLATLTMMGAALTPAFAREGVTVVAKPSDLPVARVKYGDLNLAERAGQRALWSRVSLAVASVCPLIGQVRIEEAMEIKNCRSSANAQARPQVAAAIERSRFNGALAAAATASIVITSPQ